MSLATDRDAERWSASAQRPVTRAELLVQEVELRRARRGAARPTRELTTGIDWRIPDLPEPTARTATDDPIGRDLARFAVLAYRHGSAMSRAEHGEFRRLESRLARAGALRAPK